MPSASILTAASCSFVGRPFALDEADVHFTRLRAYGCSLIRLIVTWEAVEHRGPGEYDEEYLAYLAALVGKAAEYSILVYVDPHQDASPPATRAHHGAWSAHRDAACLSR